MRFQQTAFRPYVRPFARKRAVLPPVNARKPGRRLWWIRPRTILLVIFAVITTAFVTDRAWVRGNGIVAGQLTAISPIVQARLQTLLVQCLDHVKRGQQIAEFVNEATEESAAQQLQQLQLQLTQARATIEIAAHEAEAAAKLVEAQKAVLTQLIAVQQAEDSLVKQGYVAVLVWQQAKAAVDRADAEMRAAEFVYATKLADQKRAALDADVLQKRIVSFQNSPELNGHFYITAPTDGVVTECTAQPGEVIAAHTPIFSLFNPNDTYAVVFFDPSDIPHLARGQTFTLDIGGLEKPVKGTLTDFYPELSALPSSLTRYFWQEEKWSQYAPARIDFTNLSEEQRGKIFAWAQLSATRSESFVTWHWVRRRLAWIWPFSSASYAQDGVQNG
jgi:multidrug resistance efflux pump